MGKAGRPKKAGERYASGGLIPKGVPGANTLWRRIKDYGVRLGLSPELGSVLGRLSLFGEISEREVEAGRYFAQIVADFERDAGHAARSARSPTYEARFYNGHGPHREALREGYDLRRSQRRYEELDRIIFDPHTRAILEAVCCDDHEISALELPTLQSGLTALANHFKIRPNDKPSTIASRQQRGSRRVNRRGVTLPSSR
jgi:hypothetical protein